MSRAWLPRRFGLGIFAFALGVAILAEPASAQRGDPRAVTIIGGDAHAQRCVAGVAAGDSSDQTLASCTRAMRNPRLNEESETMLLINRGIVHLRRNDSEAAITDFDTVLEDDRRHAEARLNRAAALVQLERYGPAIAEITQALSLGVAEPHKAYFNRGVAREALGDLRGAYEDYSTALEIQPDWGPANAELARFVRTRRDHVATVLSDDPAQQ
jgi:tetratricopeptide (TPR) repeat protein